MDEARIEAERTLTALEPFVSRGVPVVGLEPSCLLSFRDEVPAMVKGALTWYLPDSVCLKGPAPHRFGITISRYAEDRYRVRMLWNRLCR